MPAPTKYSSSVKLQPMDPPAAPGKGFFFDEAEMSQRAVTSPWTLEQRRRLSSPARQPDFHPSAEPRSVKPASLFSSWSYGFAKASQHRVWDLHLAPRLADEVTVREGWAGSPETEAQAGLCGVLGSRLLLARRSKTCTLPTYRTICSFGRALACASSAFLRGQ